MRHSLWLSILCAAVLSCPIAVGAVLVHWTSVEPRTVLAGGLSPALWSARTFLAYFDISMLVTVIPCAWWTSRFSKRLQQMKLAPAEPD